VVPGRDPEALRGILFALYLSMAKYWRRVAYLPLSIVLLAATNSARAERGDASDPITVYENGMTDETVVSYSAEGALRIRNKALELRPNLSAKEGERVIASSSDLAAQLVATRQDLKNPRCLYNAAVTSNEARLAKSLGAHVYALVASTSEDRLDGTLFFTVTKPTHLRVEKCDQTETRPWNGQGPIPEPFCVHRSSISEIRMVEKVVSSKLVSCPFSARQLAHAPAPASEKTVKVDVSEVNSESQDPGSLQCTANAFCSAHKAL
jgi:hypothetical protein